MSLPPHRQCPSLSLRLTAPWSLPSSSEVTGSAKGTHGQGAGWTLLSTTSSPEPCSVPASPHMHTPILDTVLEVNYLGDLNPRNFAERS